MKDQWFSVDKAGLGRQAEEHSKGRLIGEIVQNGLDEDGVTKIDITLALVAGRPIADLTVEDDSPEGFRDLTHAYTLFAQSYKRDNPEKRGQFNLGEKMVLAVCEAASISTTKGSVVFDPQEGRIEKPRQKRERGSVFQGRLKIWWTPLSRPKNCIPSVQYRVWIQFHIPTPSGPPCPRRSCSHRRPFTGAEGLRCEQERLFRIAHAASAPVHFPGRPPLQRLVRAFLVVEREVPSQAPLQLRHDLVAAQVHVLVLHRPPQTFHKHVVQTPTPTVHAHRRTRRLHPARPRLARELNPLVRVEHLGRPRPNASSSISRQNEPSSVLDSRQQST